MESEIVNLVDVEPALNNEIFDRFEARIKKVETRMKELEEGIRNHAIKNFRKISYPHLIAIDQELYKLLEK